jgi:protein-disulfide isomerase
VDYNRRVIRIPGIKLQRHVFPVFLVGAWMALAGASCENKSSAQPDPDGVVNAYDSAHGKTVVDENAEPASTDPVPGADLSKLDGDKTSLFHKLADSLPSPCGDARSLRAASQPDARCKRASFAAGYVVALLADGMSTDEVIELYEARYKDIEQHTFELTDRPHLGPADAKVKVVEFFDYGCPACKQFGPVLKEALTPYIERGQAVLYYKQYPLPSHSDSDGAAQAAVAAGKQGKYEEMHEMLFANQHRHKKSDLDRYAESIGLDMEQFQKDYAAAKAVVTKDVEDGEASNVRFTPTTFVNGRLWQGPASPAYIRMWIDEELAVNR